MMNAVQRRNQLEAKFEGAELPKDVKAAEFRIYMEQGSRRPRTKLVRIKALQLERRRKIDLQTKQQFIQRLKRDASIARRNLSYTSNEKKQLS